MGIAPLGLIFLVLAGASFLFATWGFWVAAASPWPHSSRLIALGLLFCVLSKFFGLGL
jgi:hypothetical protein